MLDLGRFFSKLVSLFRDISTVPLTNTLAYYKIHLLLIRNVFIVQAPEQNLVNTPATSPHQTRGQYYTGFLRQ
jgi:hypothetical protein